MGEKDPGKKRPVNQAEQALVLNPQTIAASDSSVAIVIFSGTSVMQENGKAAPLTVEAAPVQQAIKAQERPTQLIRTRDDIGQMKEAERVQLSRQSVVNVASVEQILDSGNYPNLRAIVIADRLAARLVRDKILALIEAQADRGIELIRERYKGRDRAKQKPSKKQEEKKRIFEELDSAKRIDYEFMKQHPKEFPEVVIAEAYFAGRSFKEISEELRFSEQLVRRIFAGLAKWAGAEYTDKVILAGRRNIDVRITRQRRKDEPRKVDEKYTVNGENPPQTLPEKRWKTWKAVQQMRLKKPGLFARLMKEEPVGYETVANFCHFPEVAGLDGEFISESDIAQKYGYRSRQAVNTHKQNFLRKLGTRKK